jgi:hypothetical protein
MRSPAADGASMITPLPHMPARASRRDPEGSFLTEWQLIAGAGIMFVLFLLYLTGILNLVMLQSDVLLYWEESLKWATPYSTWWVPGYPLTVALVRALTFGVLPPTITMVLVTGTFYLVSVRAVYVLARCIELPYPSQVAALFAVYPFVGLTYSVYPVADAMVTALLLLCFIAYERQQWWRLTVYAAFAILVHKSSWFSIPPLLLFVAVRHRSARLVVPFAMVPLLVWIAAGALHYGDVFWFARWSVDKLVVSRHGLPVADGLIGPFLIASPAKVFKGLVVAGVVATAALCAWFSWAQRFWTGVAICLPILAMAFVLNEYEIWAVVRFSRMLVIPAAYAAMFLLPPTEFRSRMAYPVLLVAAVASNFVYGYYVSAVYFR